MNQSPTLTKLAPALLKAQRNIKTATKDASNPFFKSKYSTLENVMEACKKFYNDEGITVLQPIGNDEQGTFVETVLMHESGEWVSSQMRVVVAKHDMQNLGSGVSYARRYSLASLGFIGTNEDNDAEGTMDRKQDTRPSAPAKVVPVVPKNGGKGNFVTTPSAPTTGEW